MVEDLTDDLARPDNSQALVDDFHAALKNLGWTKAELCRRLGLSKDAPRRWIEGPPKYVVAYLDLALSLKVLAEKVERGR